MARVAAKCCWCGGAFFKWEGFYWCKTEACRIRQANFSVVMRKDVDGKSTFTYLFVPLPKQVEFEECGARNLLGGGAAGSTKSHICRWSMYRRALKVPYYEGLLLRRTWPELEKHHFRLMEREAAVFRAHGLNVEFSKTNREMYFHDTKGVIEGGHMENASDVDKYLGRERDDIAVDEGVTFEPHPLLQLSTRARSTKQEILDMGGARFRVYTNPGGAAASMLRDLFIDHTPDWEEYSEEFKDEYNPAEWKYIPGNLEDNPYLPPSYQADLSVLQPWRFKQLRYNDWDVIAGTFFTEFVSRPPYVQDLGDFGDSVEWFRSMDWGYVQPGCVLWWACLPDGIFYIRHEFKFSHATIDIVAQKIKDYDEELGIHKTSMRYTVADPALKGVNVSVHSQAGEITGESMAESFSKEGIPLIMGRNDRYQGWTRVREMLKLREDQRPSIVIHPDCKYLIRTLASAVSAKNDPEDVDTSIDDHAIDSLRYGAMSRPAATKVRTAHIPNSFNAVRANMIKFRRRTGTR